MTDCVSFVCSALANGLDDESADGLTDSAGLLKNPWDFDDGSVDATSFFSISLLNGLLAEDVALGC